MSINILDKRTVFFDMNYCQKLPKWPIKTYKSIASFNEKLFPKLTKLFVNQDQEKGNIPHFKYSINFSYCYKDTLQILFIIKIQFIYFKTLS